MAAQQTKSRTEIGCGGGLVVQFILTTLPLLGLLIYFLVLAARRPSADCYQKNGDNNGDDAADVAEECSQLIPLSQMICVFLVCGYLWTILAVYLTAFVPRRHALIQQYLDQGKATVGDVFYRERGLWGRCIHGHNSYGYLTYPHLNYKAYPVYIRRQVRVFQLYTRERAPILVLPDHPYSGLPKEELEVDLAISERNRTKMMVLAVYAWLWVAFSFAAPVFVMEELSEIDEDPFEVFAGDEKWIWYTLICGCAPLLALFVNWLAWKRHEYWVLLQASIFEEGDRRDGCGGECGCDDDVDYFGYEPPPPPSLSTSSENHQQQKKTNRFAMARPSWANTELTPIQQASAGSTAAQEESVITKKKSNTRASRR